MPSEWPEKGMERFVSREPMKQWSAGPFVRYSDHQARLQEVEKERDANREWGKGQMARAEQAESQLHALRRCGH
jgi:hypothetical protein